MAPFLRMLTTRDVLCGAGPGAALRPAVRSVQDQPHGHGAELLHGGESRRGSAAAVGCARDHRRLRAAVRHRHRRGAAALVPEPELGAALGAEHGRRRPPPRRGLIQRPLGADGGPVGAGTHQGQPHCRARSPTQLSSSNLLGTLSRVLAVHSRRGSGSSSQRHGAPLPRRPHRRPTARRPRAQPCTRTRGTRAGWSTTA